MTACPRCENQLSYVDQYKQWYCYNCKEYQQPQVAPQAPPRPHAPIGRGDERMDRHPPQPAIDQIIKRPMTDMERELVAKLYRSGRILLILLWSLVLLIFSLLVYNSLFPSWLWDWTMLLLYTIFLITMIGSVIAHSVRVKKMADVLKDGTAIEVHGSGLRTRTAGVGQYFTVGPISLFETKEVLGMTQEGAQVSVLCIPKLKIALSINNIGLKKPAITRCPPNIEETAVFKAAEPPDYPGQQLPPPPPDQTIGQNTPQQPPQPTQQPQPHQIKKQDRFCPYCGSFNSPDFNYCIKCKKPLSEVK